MLDQSNTSPCNVFHLRSILILYSHLRMSSWWRLSHTFSTKTLCSPLLCSLQATCPCHLIPPDLLTQVTFDDKCGSLSSTLAIFSNPPLPLPSLAQYLPQYQPLKHPQNMIMLSLVFISKHREYHYFFYDRFSCLSFETVTRMFKMTGYCFLHNRHI